MTDARFNGIARILKENMNKSVANGTFGMGCELAEITANGLKVNGYKDEIQDYLVLENLTLKEDYFTFSDEVRWHIAKVIAFRVYKALGANDNNLLKIMVETAYNDLIERGY